MIEGQVLNQVHVVRGVAGGFVVGGIVNGFLVAAHYDIGTRTCRVHAPGVVDHSQHWQWTYYRDLHSVVTCGSGNLAPEYGLDLASGGGDPATLRPHALTQSATLAIERAKTCLWPNTFSKSHAEQSEMKAKNWICLNPVSGTVSLGERGKITSRFTPLADGQPLLRMCELLSDALQEGSILAFFARQDSAQVTTARLMLFRLPEGIPIGDYPQPKHYLGYTLSRGDGRLVAFQDYNGRLLLRATTPGSDARHPLPTGEYPQQVKVELGDYWLAIGPKNRKALFVWEGGRLQVLHGTKLRGRVDRIALDDSVLAVVGELATEWHVTFTNIDSHIPIVSAIRDTQRFVAWAEKTLIAGLDRFGQVALFDREGRLLCMFFVLNRQNAVWMPDGTCFGSGHLLGRSPTPGAAEIIGRTLFEATQQSKGA
jgi:hypothetical protein